MFPSSIRTFMSLTQQPSTLRRVLVARLMPSLMASSKPRSETALISVTDATVMSFLPPFFPSVVGEPYVRRGRVAKATGGMPFTPFPAGGLPHPFLPRSARRQNGHQGEGKAEGPRRDRGRDARGRARARPAEDGLGERPGPEVRDAGVRVGVLVGGARIVPPLIGGVARPGSWGPGHRSPRRWS